MMSGPSCELPQAPLFYITLSGTRGFPKRYFENVMISAGGLWSTQRGKFIRRNPPAHKRFFLDSGGFNALHRFGDYPWSLGEYVDLINHYQPDFVATMDYPCEPDINRRLLLGGRTGSCALQTNKERIAKTVEHTISLIDSPVGAHTTIVPVIQGYLKEEYLECIDLYKSAGIFKTHSYFAVGSMCRRGGILEILKAVCSTVDYARKIRPDSKFHFFGLKIKALKERAIFVRAHSTDSAAWSLNPDRESTKRYCKDPVGDGVLDTYLEKLSLISVDHNGQSSFDRIDLFDSCRKVI